VTISNVNREGNNISFAGYTRSPYKPVLLASFMLPAADRPMQEQFPARLMPYLLAGAILALTGSVVVADVVQDCRAEIGMYGIPPEQAEDYVQGCIQSRGGYPAAAGQPETADSGTDGAPDEAAGGTGDGMPLGDHSGVEETTDGAQ
jgi:hypothetical protein